jgi:hypothetical protein
MFLGDYSWISGILRMGLGWGQSMDSTKKSVAFEVFLSDW